MTSATTPVKNRRRVLPDALRLGPVELVVGDLDRAVAFYQDAIGLRPFGDDALAEPGRAVLGAGGDEPVVVLVEDPAAVPAGRHAGLYHVALLHPSRLELARAALRLAATRTPIQGASDHVTHEAIYLADPDGNGLELAADRPRASWPTFQEQYAGGPQPLDLDALLALVAGEKPERFADPAYRVGHVHLHVGDLETGRRFYEGVLGFDVVADLGTAVFASAGGYHHHVAINTWRGVGAPAVPPHAAGLRRWTIDLAGAAGAPEALRARAEQHGVAVDDGPAGALILQDPWGVPVLVRP